MRQLFWYATVMSLISCGSEPRPADIRPNIVLVMADDQGWGDMEYVGHPDLLTPNFNALATEGMRFDRFYAAAPVCSPTRGSVMTGRHPNRFGCFTWGRTLRPQETTLAEVLKEAGYATGHFGKWHLGSVRLGDPVNPGASGFDEWFSAPNFFDNDPILSRNGIAEQTRGESSTVTVQAALEFIKRNTERGIPYFAVIWFGSPHGPHEALETDRERYRDLPGNLQHFYGEITAMDRAFGILRTELVKLKDHENTFLWYCSDNGGLPEIGATGGRGNKGSVYEGGLRVPALVEWPAVIHNPRKIKLPASTSDIFPTVLDVAGVSYEPEYPLDGISLLPLFRGEDFRRSKAIGFWQYPAQGVRTPSAEWMPELLEAQRRGEMSGDSSRIRLDAGVISKRYSPDTLTGHAAWLDWPLKLHRIETPEGSIHWELYNLESDSMETQNIADQGPVRLSEMKTALETWQRSVIRSLNGEDYE